MLRFLAVILLLISGLIKAQETHPINGVTDKTHGHFLFYNGTIHTAPGEAIQKGVLEIKDGKVVSVSSVRLPVKGAILVDLKGKHVYPSFIDLFTSYGMPSKAEKKGQRGGQPQLESKKKGAFSWNEAIKAEFNASEIFSHDPKALKPIIANGFGTVLSHNKDGIARGTAVLSTLNDDKEQNTLVIQKAADVWSFSKGSSKQSYPSSLMGSIALIRQTLLDAQWYEETGSEQMTDLSLDAILRNKSLPKIFDAGAYLNQLRAHKIAVEFNQEFILKGRGEEYKRLSEFAKIKARLIVPLHFPLPVDPKDPYETLLVPLEDLKEWEQAPYNAGLLEKEGIEFALTADGLKKPTEFLPNLRKAVKRGLSKTTALAALTVNPATFVNVHNQLGKLEKGYIANFIITSGDIFEDDSKIYENWIRGEKNTVTEEKEFDVRGIYHLKVNDKDYRLEVDGSEDKFKAKIVVDTIKVPVDIGVDRKLISLSFESPDTTEVGMYRLSGQVHFDSGVWEGTGVAPDGNWKNWSAIRQEKHKEKEKPNTPTDSLVVPEPWYPNMAYGGDTLPAPTTILIKNATVWTNEEQGILKNTSILIQNGKIVSIGNILDIANPNGLVIDAKGKHVTCGIIDEHSHIAISGGVNESGQAIAAEVRLGDVINPDDINIYRQLAGGVTTSQLLHGSADPIGGQSALIKLKWGQPADSLKFKNAPGFIKFALGENVKQSNWGDYNTIRFPQTRMGVEQIYYDAFIKAREYESVWKEYEKALEKRRRKEELVAPRRDLELDALVEILNSERFITCHSYVQSEINMLMHVADSMGFTLNTFTHILEGYKVADKMKAHGVGASTFSDWWAYKYEVKDAIPYNAALLDQMGIVTAINSDDAEMARRLNQEAAKAVKYGAATEEEAWEMVTLNPAKLLHIDDRVGSIKVGKDADIVIWSDNPLSVYARVEKTIIDGTVYYDAEQEEALRERNALERERILLEMKDAKAGGAKTRAPQKKAGSLYNCTIEFE